MTSADDGPCKMRKSTRPPETLHLLPAVVVWLVTGTTISSLNKWIFVVYDFRYPLLLSALHMLTAIVIGFIKYWFVQDRGVAEPDLTSSAKCKVFLLSLTFCASIAFGNIGLNYVPLSFAQMIYTTTPIFTLAVSSLVLGKQHHVLKYTAMMPICLGAWFSIMGEVQFDQTGCLFVLAATMLRAIKSIQQSILLQEEKINSVFLLYMMAIPSFCILAVAALVLENWAALQSPHHYDGHLWAFIVLSCLGSVLYNLASSCVISLTSAVTLHILGNLSVVGNLLLSQLLFGSQLSSLSCTGAALTLSGMIIYQNTELIVAYVDAHHAKASNGKICTDELQLNPGDTCETSSCLDPSHESSSDLSSEFCLSPEPSLELYDDSEPWEELYNDLETPPLLEHDLKQSTKPYRDLQPSLKLNHVQEPHPVLNQHLDRFSELCQELEPLSEPTVDLEPSLKLDHELETSVELDHGLETSVELDHGLETSVELDHGLETSVELDHGLETSVELDQGLGTSVELDHELETPVELDHGLETPVELDHGLGTSVELDHGLGTSVELDHGLGTSVELDHGLGTSVELDHGLGTSVELDHGLGTSVELDRELETSVELERGLGTSVELERGLGTSVELERGLGTSVELDQEQRPCLVNVVNPTSELPQDLEQFLESSALDYVPDHVPDHGHLLEPHDDPESPHRRVLEPSADPELFLELTKRNIRRDRHEVPPADGLRTERQTQDTVLPHMKLQ